MLSTWWDMMSTFWPNALILSKLWDTSLQSRYKLKYEILHQKYHPSIFYTAYPEQGLRGAGADPSCHWGEWWGGAWTGRHSVRGPTYRDRQPLTVTFTPTGDLESPINLHVSGRKPESPEENKQTPHRRAPSASGSELRTLWLWGDSAATAPPCRPIRSISIY